MTASFQEALIKQQLEFTLSELEEYKKKEEALKKTNDSLLKALGTSNQAPTHAITEYQKSLELLQIENSELKSKLKEQQNNFEQEKLDLTLAFRELELTIKQQKIGYEGEKLKLLGSIQKLESENMHLTNSAKMKSLEKQSSYENQKNQLSELMKTFMKEKEDLIKENEKIREQYDKAVMELKTTYESENVNLRNNLSELQKKVKGYISIIDDFKDKGGDYFESRNEELECQVEYYKELYLNANISGASKRTDENEDKMKFRVDLQNILNQKEKIELELEKSQLEIIRLKLESAKLQEKYWENERNLKNEIKILIGKLMKAKSKLSSEGDFKDTLKQDYSLNSIRLSSSNRSNSSNRSRNSQKY